MSAQRDHDRPRRSFGRLWRGCVALAALCLLLSACANAQFGSEFSLDGSATHSVTISFDHAGLDAATTARIRARIDSADEQLTSDGFETEHVDNPSTFGLRANYRTPNGTEAGAALNALFNAITGDLEEGPFAPFTGGFDRVSGAVGGSAYALELTADMDLIYQALTLELQSLGVDTSEDDLRAQLAITYLATMPGDIKDTNGEQVNNDSVRWQLPTTGTATLEAQSKTGARGSTAWFVLAAIGGVIAVAVVAAGVGAVLFWRRRAQRERVPTAPADVAGERHPQQNAGNEPATMSEVGSTLVRVVERVVAGKSPARERDGEREDAPDEPAEPPR